MAGWEKSGGDQLCIGPRGSPWQQQEKKPPIWGLHQPLEEKPLFLHKWGVYGFTPTVCCSWGPGGAQGGRGHACLLSAHRRQHREAGTHAKITQNRHCWPLTWDWSGCSRISIFVTCAYMWGVPHPGPGTVTPTSLWKTVVYDGETKGEKNTAQARVPTRTKSRGLA